MGAGSDIHVIRFYLPALGLISLLAAWLLVQLPRWLPVVLLVVLIGLGARSYPNLVPEVPEARVAAQGAPRALEAPEVPAAHDQAWQAQAAYPAHRHPEWAVPEVRRHLAVPRGGLSERHDARKSR